MFHHLLRLAARASARSLSKPNASTSATAQSRRCLSSSMTPPTRSVVAVAAGTGLGFAMGAGMITALFIGDAFWSDEDRTKVCDSRQKLTILNRKPSWEKRGSNTKESFVQFNLYRPEFFSWWFGGTDMYLKADVEIKLPKSDIESDYKEICNLLKHNGVDVEEVSEARLALTHFALQHLHKGAKEHYEKTCQKKCALVVAQSATA